jgi:Phage tail sheath protein subtilisin-like domain/Phage tail sheath C-terminal domain
MASTQLSPGVVVVERDLTTVANTVVDNVGVIAGAFEKGPVEEVVDITSERQLLSVFGKPNDDNYEFWFSASQFLLYGGSLKVIRTTNASLRNAIDKAQVTVANLTANDTTITVVSSLNFTVNDYLKIDDEIVKVTAVSGNDVTVLRGQLATAAVSHSAGRPVTLIEPQGANATTIDEGATFSSSDTTLTVDNSASLSIAVNGYILIENEILQVTAISGDNLTVLRGQLGTSASSHANATAVTKVIVSVDATNLNETTTTGVTPPLIKNLSFYETTVESASNPWSWAIRTPGSYGNSVKIVMTDAGADQVLSLSAPTSGVEWDFPTSNAIAFPGAGVTGKVYHYSVLIRLASTNLSGTFEVGDAVTAQSGTVTGTVVSYDPGRRLVELTNLGGTTYFQAGQTLDGPDGDGTIEVVERKLYAHLTSVAKFQANQTVSDDAARSVTIQAVRDEYEDREYGDGQRWINVAPRPGTSQFISERGGKNDEMHILVLDADGKITGSPGSLLEKFLFVSKASNAKGPQGENNYYKDVIKANSQYLYWGSHEQNEIFDVNDNASGAIGQSGINRSFDLLKSSVAFTNTLGETLIGTKNNATIQYVFSGGSDGYSISRDQILSAYDLVADQETVKVDYLLMGPSFGSFQDSVAKAQKLIDIANTRKDCIAFISPIRGDVIGQVDPNVIVDRQIVFYSLLASSSYAVFDSNYKYIYDKYNDTYRYIPCNADVAGLCLQTTVNQEPWYSPAGLNRGNLKNAIKVAFSPLKDQRDKLYANRINPIVNFPGQGIVLFGDKTALGYQSAFDRINVRRLFLAIERTISDAAKQQLFELNDEITRSSFKNIIEPYLRQVQGRRGIVDFLVVCDGTNNPPESIDRGEFYAEIYVKPTRSINFITLTFVATRTGTAFAEIVS